MTEELKNIACTFPTETSLYLAYMPFIKGGGLFIRTNPVFSLGTRINLTINLLDEPDIYSVNGTIVWITPKGAQGGKPHGIGLQFDDEVDSRNLCNKIEMYLAGKLKSNQLTDTI